MCSSSHRRVLVQPKKKEDLVQDKMTRMPRSELIELIFSCFRRQVQRSA
jgi:hypothetical protein